MMAEGDSGFRYTSAPERRQRLVKYITEQGYCTTAELSGIFGVSEMTIRRDVSKLVENGEVRGFRGGVGSLTREDLAGSDYRLRDLKMGAAKHAIAEAALDFVGANSVIAIDAGTTGAHLASILPNDRMLSVITHSFPVVSSLVGNSGVEVMCLGGTLHPDSLSFDGPATLAAISNLHVPMLFLAATGLGDRGVFCGNGFDAITKRALIDVSERVVLIADSSKFQNQAMVRVCGWDAIDTIIVDSGIGDAQRRLLVQHGVTMTIVGAESPLAELALDHG
jgi:DeoR family transcriptional regulator, aga operon transcriptional repressor